MSFKPANLQAWRQHFVQYEGRCRAFYLDGKDNVTIGIGSLVTSPTVLPMVRKSTGIRASVDDIMADYKAVRALLPGQLASYYDRVCLLYLPDTDIDALFERELTAKIQSIEDSIVSLEDYPDLAALVLVDMAYNLGIHGLTAKFPKFMNAFLAKDWKVAALECKREGIQPSRNDWARTTMESLIQFQK